MAKILYGVAGEGSGHSSRTKEICRHLKEKGHEIKIVSHGRGYDNLRPYFDTEKIFGLHFAYKDNKVQYNKTIINNALKTPQAIKSLKEVLGLIDSFKPSIVFSDFEPISCIAANIKKLPLISVDNQHRITNTAIKYPKKYESQALAAKTVINLMIFNSKACLVTSFFKAKALNRKTFVFPPILRKEVLDLKPKPGNKILVYVTSEFNDMIDVLKNINKKFIVYGFNKNKKDKNLTFKKPSQKRFLRDLANSEGVIANAGFTLMTEALYLRKPYLALPVAGQFEQILNAYYLEKLGYGKHWDELNKERIESFLFNLDLCNKNLRKYKKEDNRKIFKKIDSLIKEYT